MRKIAVTNKYKKDLELAKRRHLPMDELNDVIYNLANDMSDTSFRKWLKHYEEGGL